MLTGVGDLVLVHINKSPAFFARLEAIEPDVKSGWWQVTFLVLQVPLKTVVWILREPYIQGETFTMGGTPVRLEKVLAPSPPAHAEAAFLPESAAGDDDEVDSSGAKIINLEDRRKK